MLFVWGRKWYARKLGFIADFCEICRRPQACALEKRTLIGHFWFIPLGTHHVVQHRALCTQCGTATLTDPARYAQPARKPAPARVLLTRTNPGFDQAFGARMALERSVRENAAALTPDQRRSMLAAPFVLLSPEVEQRVAQTNLGWQEFVAMLCSFALLPIGRALGSLVSEEWQEHGFVIGLFACILAVLWLFSTSKRRWARSRVLPRLMRNLAPLKPRAAEIGGILGELRQHKHKLGTLLKVADFTGAKSA